MGELEGRNVLFKKLARELREKSLTIGLDIKKRVTHRTVPGWEGKGKGLLQILWEQGWVDETMVSQYKLSTKESQEYPLTHLMDTCADFENELSQLAFVCHSLGAKALTTTKYHAEYAGEGIEYSWGAAKQFYQKYPLASKRGKTNFDTLVGRCTSRDVLTVELVRKFSRQARSYMLTYTLLDNGTGGGGRSELLDSGKCGDCLQRS